MRMYWYSTTPVAGIWNGFLHREHGVGLADRPALDELRQLRHVLVVALRRAAVDPREDGRDFLVATAADRS